MSRRARNPMHGKRHMKKDNLPFGLRGLSGCLQTMRNAGCPPGLGIWRAGGASRRNDRSRSDNTQHPTHLNKRRKKLRVKMATAAPPDPLPEFVYKITPTAPPDPIPEAYPLSDLDRQDGFVHLSTAKQVS
jgi:hypothetical protein